MSANVKEIVSWMGIIGIPSLFVIISALVKWFIKSYKQMKILMKAQKAQMRSQLLNQFYKYQMQGYISSDDLDDWMNQYDAYHQLVGNNGVLEARRNVLLAMKSTPDGRN